MADPTNPNFFDTTNQAPVNVSDPNDPNNIIASNPPQTQSTPVMDTTGPDISNLPVSPTPQMPTATAAPQLPPASGGNKWDRVLNGIIWGLAGGAGQKTFAAGMGGGARMVLQMQQQQKQNAIEQQKMQLATQQAADTHATAQQNLAVSQANLAILRTQYALLPKTVQEQLDRSDMEAGQKLRSEGVPVVSGDAGLSYRDAQQRVMAERNANPDAALQYIMHARPDGKYDIFQVTDPSRTNDKPVDVTIGYDLKGKPIMKHYDAHQITIGQRINIETTAATTMANNQTELEMAKQKEQFATNQAGQRAYAEEAGRNKADMQALGSGTQTVFGDSITPPPGGVKEYNKRQDAFKKNADNLSQTEQTFNQFQSILSDINSGKDITGAQSVVGLFNAIGISAEPLKGKGFRINNNTVEEHVKARGLGQDLYQKLLSLKDGDIITPQQLKDYATIAMNARRDAYITNYNQAKASGVNPDFLLPQGNGKQIDSSTAQIYLTLAGGDPNKARAAAQAKGWKF